MKNLPRTVSAIRQFAHEHPFASKISRRVVVTIERELLTIRTNPPDAGFTAFCAKCLRDTLLIPIEAAMIAVQLTPREVYRLVEAGALHFHETPPGQVFICIESLTSFLAQRLEQENRASPMLKSALTSD